MASIHGTVAAPGFGAYTSAKHAVVGLTKNAAVEYASKGLRINCVGPAYIETPLLAGLPDAHRKDLIARHPLGRLGRPDEVAPLVCFLLSDESGMMTCACIDYDQSVKGAGDTPKPARDEVWP